MERLTQAREAELKYVREQNDLEITKSREVASIEIQKFKDTVSAIGSDTICAIANAGPAMQVCICRVQAVLGFETSGVT